MDITFKPMPKEPKFKRLPAECRPNATYKRTFDLLRYELVRIGAVNVVLEAGFTDRQLRQDGTPRAETIPSHSTVRITFQKGKDSLSFTCGGHGKWVQNVYLIGMTLERLRAIDRYGCIQGDEQYRGFSALPPGASSILAAEWASVADAIRFLSEVSGIPLNIQPGQGIKPEALKHLYNAAAMKTHPDLHGGSEAMMAKVNRAHDFIEKEQAT